MIRSLRRGAYLLSTVLGAVALLAGTSLAVERARAPEPKVENSERRYTRDFLAYNRRNGSHVFRAKGLVPGDTQQRLLVVGNDGRRRLRTIRAWQDEVTNTGFGPALGIQLWDRTTNRCIYPAPRAGEPELGDCRRWGSWNAGAALQGAVVRPRWTSTWRPGERHVIAVRFALRESSANADQGQLASFRLRWTYSS